MKPRSPSLLYVVMEGPQAKPHITGYRLGSIGDSRSLRRQSQLRVIVGSYHVLSSS